jgi:hypothetical protein
MALKQSKTAPTTRKRTAVSQSTARSTLSSIARGMQHAVNSTQDIMEDHYTRVFDRYFDKDGSPKMVKFNVTPEQVVQAPLIALVPLNMLVLDEMVVEMSVEVVGTSDKKVATRTLGLDTDRSSFTVSFTSGDRTGGKTGKEPEQENNTIDIVMKFKRGDPPEGVARVVDEFYKAVVTRPTKKEGK